MELATEKEFYLAAACEEVGRTVSHPAERWDGMADGGRAVGSRRATARMDPYGHGMVCVQ